MPPHLGAGKTQTLWLFLLQFSWQLRERALESQKNQQSDICH